MQCPYTGAITAHHTSYTWKIEGDITKLRQRGLAPQIEYMVNTEISVNKKMWRKGQEMWTAKEQSKNSKWLGKLPNVQSRSYEENEASSTDLPFCCLSGWDKSLLDDSGRIMEHLKNE